MEVPLRRRPLTEVHDGATARAFHGEGGSDGVRDLRGERGGHGEEVEGLGAEEHGHRPPATFGPVVAEQLVGDILYGEASPEEDAGLAVLPKDHVPLPEGGGRSHEGRLLARGGHVEGDAALAVGGHEDHVDLLQLDHGAVHALQLRVLDQRQRGPLPRLARLGQERENVKLREVALRREDLALGHELGAGADPDEVALARDVT
mmetsp:Transcript_64942/g.146501  ORF Transcript_64942/g.146501 Transcript_64942/m.146501 type:complete len:204 (-) Transcript_64942:281-892(-)